MGDEGGITAADLSLTATAGVKPRKQKQGHQDRSDRLWEDKYQYLVRFKAKHGHTKVTHHFVFEGIKLGVWVDNQRSRYKEFFNRRTGTRRVITQDQIDKLNAIGFDWGPKSGERSDKAVWYTRWETLQEYKEAHGHVNVPRKYEENGVKLGCWVQTQRGKLASKKEDGTGDKATRDRIKRLDELGFRWDTIKRHQQKSLAAAKAENAGKHKDQAPIVGKSSSLTKKPLAAEESATVRTAATADRSLTATSTEREGAKLKERTESPRARNDRLWEEKYDSLVRFKAKYGHTMVHRLFVFEGFKLGTWVAKQRLRYKQSLDTETGNPWSRGVITQDRIDKLNAIGFVWAPGQGAHQPDEAGWDRMWHLLQRYKEAHGHMNVPGKYEENGVKLGSWVKNQRNLLASKKKDGTGDKTSRDRIKRLDDLGFRWYSIKRQRQKPPDTAQQKPSEENAAKRRRQEAPTVGKSSSPTKPAAFASSLIGTVSRNSPVTKALTEIRPVEKEHKRIEQAPIVVMPSAERATLRKPVSTEPHKPQELLPEKPTEKRKVLPMVAKPVAEESATEGRRASADDDTPETTTFLSDDDEDFDSSDDEADLRRSRKRWHAERLESATKRSKVKTEDELPDGITQLAV